VRRLASGVVGKTGSGKSTLVKNLILQDIDRQVGVGVISHEHDFFHNRLLPAFPQHRSRDLIYFDPSDLREPIIAVNPFRLEPGEDLHLKAGELYTIFSRAMGGELGVRMKTLFLHAVYPLLETLGSTVQDFARLLDPEQDAFRQRVLRTPNLDEQTR
jgi:hypothetical protein